MIPNYYSILGVPHTSTKKEIKKAYRKLALKTHPDQNKRSDAKEKFIEINEAYLILSDTDARKRYDIEYLRCYHKESNNTDSNFRGGFRDENLNNWAENAKRQAKKYANMSFNKFSRLVRDITSETSFQILNICFSIVGILLVLPLIDGVFSLFSFFKTTKIDFTVILMAFIGFFILAYTYRSQRSREGK